MILTESDYKVVIGDNAYKTVSQADEFVVSNAEREAREEMAGYLRPKYDVDAIFSAEGNRRNPVIVMYLCDLALYHLSASLPQKMGSEVRKERYERAIKWLEGVQAGKIVPDLPVATDENGEPTGFLFKYSSQPKQKNNW